MYDSAPDDTVQTGAWAALAQRAGWLAPSSASARVLHIGPHRIADDTDAFVIAEIGHNHQGSVDKCLALFQAAKDAGVQAVKLQKRDNARLFTHSFYHQPYHSENAFGATYGAHREALEFGHAEYRDLRQAALDLGLVFFATAFDVPSAHFLAELDVPCYKLASGDLTNTPLLRTVARLGKPIILSTGAASMADVLRAVDVVLNENAPLALLQCTATYPTEYHQLNLNVLSTYREAFPDVVVGLSSHDSGIAMATAAYLLGARVIEKHFTLNRAMKGTDHAFSLEPVGMRKLVRDLQRLRLALGDGVKRVLPEETQARVKMGKKVVAAGPLPAGHVLAWEDLAFKSPGDGLPPAMAEALLGQRLLRDVGPDEDITFELVGAATAPQPATA